MKKNPNNLLTEFHEISWLIEIIFYTDDFETEMLLKILHICLCFWNPNPILWAAQARRCQGQKRQICEGLPRKLNTLTEMCSRPLVTDAPAFGQKMGVTEQSGQKWLHSNPMYLSYPKLVSDSHIFLAPNSTRKAQHTTWMGFFIYSMLGNSLGEKQPGQLRGNHSGWYSKWLRLCQAESK